MGPQLFHVRFVGTPGHFGAFETQAKAQWWARHECDGRAFTIHSHTPTL